MAPTLSESVPITLKDGRRARIKSYDDGSVRFQIDGTPYAVAECFLGGAKDHAIIKLIPTRKPE